ncbi:Mor transcription activator family protein [Enterococcus asini]|uniref:Mor transcription activator family protein n=1 Tax=Enterococcus asini TaxID=57732 RepID=UPI00241F96DD|nr:Mor transcription activator family protein [Enterococcus asini]
MEPVDIYSWNTIYREFAKLIGVESTLEIFENYHGTQINFPMRLVSSDHIKQVVLNEYDGTNLKELAMFYGYSERHLRRLLKDETKEIDSGGDQVKEKSLPYIQEIKKRLRDSGLENEKND